ncbi:MAG: PadR family transcriptional regulator [Stenomitos rutilans HA7619-LM2]|jgi:DNA-binding PadR family transcriptional regulator|nr:PadR family transcriptional regulator [Stenomitos rutilans HA7619-LM2]
MFRLFHPYVWALASADAPEEPSVCSWFQHGNPFGHDAFGGGRFNGGKFGGWGRDRPGRHPRGEGGGGWGDERRTRRGDIKFILLELLAERPRHGYDLIKELETRYGGFRRLSPGSVYPTLQMLEDGGYLTSETTGGKRVYTITEEGTQLLAERNQQAAGSPWDAFNNVMAGKPQEFIDLRNAATELAGAVMQVARSGDAARMQRVRDRLDQMKREIYAILAEE